MKRMQLFGFALASIILTAGILAALLRFHQHHRPQRQTSPFDAVDRLLEAENAPARVRVLLQADLPFGSHQYLDLNPGDRDELERAYRAAGTLLDKSRIARALGLVGDNDSADLLIRTLKHDYRLAPVTPNDADRLPYFILALGFLAHGSDRAYEFLKAYAYSNAWAKAVAWSATGSWKAERCACYTVMAIGLSGRPDTRVILQAIRDHDNARVGRAAGRVHLEHQEFFDIANFLSAYAEKFGYQQLRESFGRPEMEGEYVAEWRKNGNIRR